jgi:hypothetical protein
MADRARLRNMWNWLLFNGAKYELETKWLT